MNTSIDPIIQTWKDNYTDNLKEKRFDASRSKPLIFLYRNKFYNNKPVILIGAGPSLDNNISLIKDIQDKAIIVCVDLALYAVQQAGITPDFVINIDCTHHVSNMWRICETRDLKLICPTTTHPNTIDLWEGGIFFFNQLDQPESAKGILLSHLIQPTSNYGSIYNRFFVGATALQLLSLVNPNVVLLLGYDFGYTQNKIYCKGVLDSRCMDLYGTPEFEIEKQNKEKKVLDNAIIIDGILTTDMMKNLYIPTFIDLIKKMKLHVVNSTEGGLLQHNNMNLKESIDLFCTTDIKKWDTFKLKKRKRKK